MKCPNPACQTEVPPKYTRQLVADSHQASFAQVLVKQGKPFNIWITLATSWLVIGAMWLLIDPNDPAFWIVVAGGETVLYYYYYSKAKLISFTPYKCPKCQHYWEYSPRTAKNYPYFFKLYDSWRLQAERKKDWRRLAGVYHDAGSLAFRYEGNYHKAMNLWHQSLQIAGQIKPQVAPPKATGLGRIFKGLQTPPPKQPRGYILTNLAKGWAYQRDFFQARQCLQESYQRLSEDNNWTALVWHKVVAGEVLTIQGEYSEAEAIFREILPALTEPERADWLAESLFSLAEIAVVRKQTTHAAHLLGAAEILREDNDYIISPIEMPRYECIIKTACQQLSESNFIAEWRKGRKLKGQIVAYALAGLTEPATIES